MTLILALIASVISASGFWIFNKEVLTGSEKPNTAAWNLWVLLTLMQLSSYFTMNRDWRLSALLITDTSLCIVTWLIALVRGKFALPPKRDYLPIALTIGSAIVWNLRSAGDANLFTQLPIMLSFIPYFGQANRGGVWAKPWVIWTIGFALYVPLVYLRHLETGVGTWYDYTPAVVGVVFHASVALLSWHHEYQLDAAY